MSLTPSVSFYVTVGIGIRLKSMSEVLEVDITSFASKSSYGSKGQGAQKSKSELCPYVCYDRCIRLPPLFSYFFCQFFCLLCCILVPSFQLSWRQMDWMKSSLFQSLFGCI